MKNALRIGAVFLVVAVVIGGAFLLLQRQRAQTASANEAPTSTEVIRGHIEETVSATGNVEADKQATLAFSTNGEIDQVLVKKGDVVQGGDLLAKLDTTSLEWQVARTQASLSTAQARLAQARRPVRAEDLASAQAAFDSAVANLDKVKEGASAEDLASAQSALDSALANLDKVREGASAEDLASARASLDSTRANLRKVQAGPTTSELASAQAAVDSAAAALRQAQTAYDRIKGQSDAGMRPESLQLQNATIEYDRAVANYQTAADRPTESELSAAEAQVSQAEAQLAVLLNRPTDGELSAAEAQVSQAEAQLATLLNRPSDGEVAAAEAQVAQAEAQLIGQTEGARAEDIAVSEAQVEEAQVALDQVLSQVTDAVLTAPFEGRLLSVDIREGEWANPGVPAVSLAAVEPLVLSVFIDEIDVAQVKEGQPAHLTFDAIQDEEIVGTVTYIAPASTNVGGAVAYALEVSFDPGALPVRLGMTADVDIVTSRVDDTILVPSRAIEADRSAGRYYVTVLHPDGTTERIEVQIGLRDESSTEVLDKLEEGDQVVVPEVPEQIERQGPFGGGGPGGGMGGM